MIRAVKQGRYTLGLARQRNVAIGNEAPKRSSARILGLREVLD